MKLLRYGPHWQEKPGLMDADGKIRDLSGVVADLDGAALGKEQLAKICPRMMRIVRAWMLRLSRSVITNTHRVLARARTCHMIRVTKLINRMPYAHVNHSLILI